MKELWKTFAAKVTAFLNRLGEDYNMLYVDDWDRCASQDAIEDGMFA